MSRWSTRQYGDQTIPLPIFNAYVLLGKLGPERIAVEGAGANARAFAARRGGVTQIVAYRFEEGNAEGTGEAVGVEFLTKQGVGDSLLTTECQG